MVTIRRIAELSGVSRGTVDRVLNDRPGVKPEIREKILKIVQEYNYVPHLAAKALAFSKKPVMFGIIMPPQEITFFDEIRNGILAAENELKDFGVRVEYRYIDTYDPNDAARAIEELIGLGASGIMFSFAVNEAVREGINTAAERGIPVITFNSDVENCNRLCFVGQDLYHSGVVAAGLMSRITGKGSRVVVVTGDPQFQAHKARVDGFLDKNEELGSPFEAIDVIQCHDRYVETYDKLMDVFTTKGPVHGVYMATGHIGACCEALKKCGLAGKTHVICNDTVPDMVNGMKEGIIDFSILQNPFMQGYKPIKLLYDYIFSGKMPESEHIYTDTSIVILESLH